MKKENLSAALNNIDFDMVEDAYDSAHSNSQKRKHFRLPRCGAIAACLCLVIAVGVLISPTLDDKNCVNAFDVQFKSSTRMKLRIENGLTKKMAAYLDLRICGMMPERLSSL